MKAIWIVGKRRYALIDSSVVEEGAQVGEQRVTRISESAVDLVGPTGDASLTLAEGIDKKLRASATKKTKKKPAGPAEKNK